MTVMTGIEISPNSRFSIHENPNVAPGFCAICRNTGGDGRTFVDFGMQLDVYGAVYFCSTCIVELAETVGFVPAAKHAEADKKAKALSIELAVVEKSFRDYRDATRSILRDCDCADLFGVPEPRSIPDSGNVSAEPKSGKADSKASKSSSK